MQSYQVVLIIAGILAALLLVNAAARAVRLRLLRRRLPFSFGVPRETVEDGLSLEWIASYWRHREPGARHAVDDTTWADLDMDKIFSALNHTCSSCGEEVLYAMLREPDTEGGRLEKLEETVRFFETNGRARDAVRYRLARLGKFTSNAAVRYFFKPEDWSLPLMTWYPLLSVLALLAIPAAFLFHKAGVLFFLVMLLCSAGLFLKTKLQMDINRQTTGYIVAMLQCARALTARAAGLPEREQKALRAALAPIRRILFFSGLLSPGGGWVNEINPVWEIFKMYFLVDLLAYRGLTRLLRKHRGAFVELYERLGGWDAALAVLSYRKSVSRFALPQFCAGVCLETQDLTHPLLPDGVPNTVRLPRGALVTGSNASGKSTFIKAVAINAILAQTVHTCTAARFCLPRCAVVTSMAVRDDVVLGKSYYIAEIRSLKRVLDGLTPALPTLCFVDEILKGTNTVERIAASSAILRLLDGQNCLAVVATHDTELTEILAACYDNYHFGEQVTDDGPVFDYMLRAGPADSKNAIRLLRFTGYPDEAVRQAEHLAARFEETRAWPVL